jgi:hypothetical protein
MGRIIDQSTICKIEVSYENYFKVNTDVAYQPFYDADIVNYYDVPEPVPATFSSMDFQEKSNPSNAGYSFEQNMSFRMVVHSKKRSQAVARLMQVKAAKIYKTDGSIYLIGRNDFFQNSPPKIEIKGNYKMIDFSMTCFSVASAGFVN